MVMTETVQLNNGIEMPKVGFGVFQIVDEQQCEQVVTQALHAGYLSIDTATAYQNESAVGRAIKNSGIQREKIFVTSKLWVADASYERAKAGIQNSLQRLGLDYLDLYLLHQPYGDVVGAWRALEEAYQAGTIRAIGVSNFHADQLKNLELTTTIKPAINQIEVNPWYQQQAAVDFARAEGIQVEAWAPFAEGKHDIFDNPVLVAIGQQYGKTASQVILRWLLQRDIVVIPKTIHEERMIENLNVCDFKLTDTDMQRIASLDQHRSQFFDHRDPLTIDQIFGTSIQKSRS
ncbi:MULTISPECIES: aldo/keto reductase [Lactiplantibacillus]|uniref:2,5-diketo-D-gluconic acid reductase n=1 Tax=Lactiplantibacillus pentosus TaxID=1589 RepID=A0ABD7IQP1_LACPE|nr:aldo/keto reductase [Lactiplantibacillus pentosus]PRO94040.1 2,5-diketo-D-gluconic acid reductase [Lactiplantibacillus pentosus]RMW46333.1 aldo/keto reductase [Lactiplantibacillus pentosus]